MREQLVKISWVGCGVHANNDLLPELSRVTNIELVAVCDLDEGKAEKACKLYGFKEKYTDYISLFEKEEFDAVIVVGPPELHLKVSELALTKNIHVFCEKPLALHLKDVKRLANLSMKNQCVTQVGHFLRHTPAIQNAKKIMNDNRFGNPICFYGSYLTFGPWENREIYGYHSLEQSYLLIQGVHIIDLAMFLIGPIKSIKSNREKSSINRLNYALSIEFENHSVGNIVMSASSPKWKCDIQIIGDKQSVISIKDAQEVTFESTTENVTTEFKSAQSLKIDSSNSYGVENRNGYTLQFQSFIDCIINKSKSYPSFKDTLEVMKWVDFLLNEEVR